MDQPDTADPFDPSLARFPTRVVALERVLDLLHVSNAPDLVLQYRMAMERGARFPPVSVVAVLGRYVIGDGHKRFSAVRGLPVASVVVEVWPLWRLGADLLAQAKITLHEWHRATVALLTRGSTRELGGLLRATVVHWWRIVRSVLTLPRRPNS